MIRSSICDGRGLYASAYRPFVSCGSSIHSGMASPPAAPPAETGLRACSGSLRAWSGKTLGTLSPNLCQGGQAPLGFPSVGGYREQDFDSCLADAPCVDDRPPTHFFVKKKFIPTCGADTTTQKVSGVFCCANAARRRNSPRTQQDAFFFTKKRPAGIRLSVRQEAGSLYRLNHPFSALQIMGIQGESLPLGGGSPGKGVWP